MELSEIEAHHCISSSKSNPPSTLLHTYTHTHTLHLLLFSDGCRFPLDGVWSTHSWSINKSFSSSPQSHVGRSQFGSKVAAAWTPLYCIHSPLVWEMALKSTLSKCKSVFWWKWTNECMFQSDSIFFFFFLLCSLMGGEITHLNAFLTPIITILTPHTCIIVSECYQPDVFTQMGPSKWYESLGFCFVFVFKTHRGVVL